MRENILEVITNTLSILHSRLAFGLADNYRLLLRDNKAILAQYDISMDDINRLIRKMQNKVTIGDPYFSVFESRPHIPTKDEYTSLVQPTIGILSTLHLIQ